MPELAGLRALYDLLAALVEGGHKLNVENVSTIMGDVCPRYGSAADGASYVDSLELIAVACDELAADMRWRPPAE